MLKRHQALAQQFVSLMKLDPNFEGIDEIRVINDGGGTGTMIVAVKEHGKEWTATRVSMAAPHAEPEVDPEVARLLPEE